MTYNTAWVVWLQLVIVFLLYVTPGDQFDAIPIYVAQGYLLVTVNLEASYNTIRTAASLLMIAAVAGFVSAYATVRSMSSAYDIFRGSVHLAAMLAVAIVMVCSSMHILNNTSQDAKGPFVRHSSEWAEGTAMSTELKRTD